jgi:hypothetical protein
VFERFRKEIGRFTLGSTEPNNPQAECNHYLVTGPVLEALSLVELVVVVAAAYEHRTRLKQPVASAVDELNHRFRQHAVGYQIDGASLKVLRIDSQYVHAEVVKPALQLLQGSGFEGANEEFLKAHEHYREGRRKAAIVEALKAFESTMKAVCAVRGIDVDPRAGAGDLITLLLDRGILPKVLTSHLTGLRTALQSGVPTLRNKEAGHGQGAEVRDVPEYLVAHALHLAAANIVLIVEAHKHQAA